MTGRVLNRNMYSANVDKITSYFCLRAVILRTVNSLCSYSTPTNLPSDLQSGFLSGFALQRPVYINQSQFSNKAFLLLHSFSCLSL